jgi:hypothetical protein
MGGELMMDLAGLQNHTKTTKQKIKQKTSTNTKQISHLK